MGSDATDATPSLEEVRWRLDAIDGELLKLLDERASLAGAVAAAKRASADLRRRRRAQEAAPLPRSLSCARPKRSHGAASRSNTA